MTSRQSPQSPRALARSVAAKGCLGFGRLLFAVALIEIVAAIVRAVAEPDAPPVVLAHLAGVTRVVYAGLGARYAWELLPLSRALGTQAFAVAACVFFALSALLALMPFFALVPERMSDATWDSLLQIVRVVSFVAGASLALLVARTFAEREAQPLVARHLAWTVMPLLACLPVAFQAINPSVVPSPWVGPALALALPWAMVAVGLMRWDVGLWATLGLGAMTGTVMFTESLGSLTLPAVALTDVLLLAVIAASGALHELAPSLESESRDTISRTLIRRLFDGTIGGAASRIGDLDPDDDKPPPDEAAEDAAHLARAMRELGIEPKRALVPDVAAVPAPEEVPLPSVIAPFVPISRSTPRPAPATEEPDPDDPDGGRLAAVVMLPTAFAELHLGLRWCFAAFVARALVVTFGLVWSASPAADVAPLVVVFDIALLASGATFAIGLRHLRKSPIPELRAPSGLALFLGSALVLCDLAAAVLRFIPGEARPSVLVGDALVGVASVACYLVVVRRLAGHLRQDRLHGRARGTLVLLVLWSVLGAATVGSTRLPASDLHWLSFPLGFASAAVGLGLWIGLLWLTRDTQDALRV